MWDVTINLIWLVLSRIEKNFQKNFNFKQKLKLKSFLLQKKSKFLQVDIIIINQIINFLIIICLFKWLKKSKTLKLS